MLEPSNYTTTPATPIRMPQLGRSVSDNFFLSCIVPPGAASRQPSGIQAPAPTVGQDARLAAFCIQPVPEYSVRSSFVDAMEPLAQWAPAAYELLVAVLLKWGVEGLIAEVKARRFDSKKGKHPGLKKFVQELLRKLTQHGRHGVNSGRRFVPEVDDIRRRYPELQQQTFAFCAVCVVLEWLLAVTKVDSRGRFERPPHSALTAKMAAVGFYGNEIHAVGTILYWPRNSKRSID